MYYYDRGDDVTFSSSLYCWSVHTRKDFSLEMRLALEIQTPKTKASLNSSNQTHCLKLIFQINIKNIVLSAYLTNVMIAVSPVRFLNKVIKAQYCDGRGLVSNSGNTCVTWAQNRQIFQVRVEHLFLERILAQPNHSLLRFITCKGPTFN